MHLFKRLPESYTLRNRVLAWSRVWSRNREGARLERPSSHVAANGVGSSERMLVVYLAGVPLCRDAVLELAGLLDDLDDELAEPPEGLAELRGTLRERRIA